jgi:hypothetical protein
MIRMDRFTRSFGVAAAVSMTAACYDNPVATPNVNGAPGLANAITSANFQVVRASGDITNALNEFRAIAGDPSNGATPGFQPGGRREITWDGVPSVLTNVDTFPGTGFASRGVTFSTPGIGFRVSDNDFGDIESTLAAQFNFLSPVRTFMSAGSNITDAVFHEPGGSTPAGVQAFGVVFSDVDRAGSTSLTLFDRWGEKIGTFTAPPRAAGDTLGLSFLGVKSLGTQIARVRITSGGRALAVGRRDVTDGGAFDLVVQDDWIFAEPQPLK